VLYKIKQIYVYTEIPDISKKYQVDFLQKMLYTNLLVSVSGKTSVGSQVLASSKSIEA
jgi:hypothetical protein